MPVTYEQPAPAAPKEWSVDTRPMRDVLADQVARRAHLASKEECYSCWISLTYAASGLCPRCGARKWPRLCNGDVVAL